MRSDYVPDYRHCLLPYVQWFQDDFLGGIRGMKAQEIGIYTVLLNEMYNRGAALDQSDERLARMCGADIRVFKRVLDDLIVDGKLIRLDCGLWNMRCENAFTSRAEMLKKQSEAGKTSAKNRRKNNGVVEQVLDERSTAVQPISEAQNIYISEPKRSSSETSSDNPVREKKGKGYSEQFEAFWMAYPRTPTMSKSKAYDAFRKLHADERRACFEAVPGYKAFLASKPDHPVMHATTFVNERRFEGFASEAAAPTDDATWTKRLKFGRSKGLWQASIWGPLPGTAGCLVPQTLIQPEDGAGWREWEQAA